MGRPIAMSDVSGSRSTVRCSHDYQAKVEGPLRARNGRANRGTRAHAAAARSTANELPTLRVATLHDLASWGILRGPGSHAVVVLLSVLLMAAGVALMLSALSGE